MINASWSWDTLNSIMFIYSSGASSQHGTGDAVRISIYSAEINLDTGEGFNGVSIYRSTRDIINPYEPNGTDLIVGLSFSTNKGRQIQLLGSSNGTQTNESFPDYTLAYIRGRSYAFIDAIQFIWSRGFSQSSPLLFENI
jgi:hypothetical protein